MRPDSLSIRALLAAFTTTSTLCLSSAVGQNFFQEIGYLDLVARLGGNVPTGASIGVGQAEGATSGQYGPNQSDAEFADIVFTAMSGPPGNSGHATTVAKLSYGNVNSVVPGVTKAWLYEAASWLQLAYLRVGSGTSVPPLVPPAPLRVFNNSWVGGAPGFENECLRRADFAIRRDDTLHFNGMNNAGGGYQTLMAPSYNGVAVGRADGQHVSGGTPAGIDGPGRQKPEIVAPGNATSWTTPIVTAIAGLLVDTAAVDPDLLLNPNADHSAVTKAVLLAGAVHRDPWTNNPALSGPDRGITTTPLDSVYGVDLVNVDRSHLILTGGEYDGAAALASAPMIDEAGWDLNTVSNSESRWWRFTIYSEAETLSILATWHRVVPTNFSIPTVANFDLRLWRVDGAGMAQTLVGDPGLPYFDSGNVVSQNVGNNLEHLFVRGLQPGTYALELDRIDSGVVPIPVGVAWIRPEETAVPGDVNGDGLVDGADVGLLLSAYGTSDAGADVNGDGIVDGADLGIVLANWS